MLLLLNSYLIFRLYVGTDFLLREINLTVNVFLCSLLCHAKKIKEADLDLWTFVLALWNFEKVVAQRKTSLWSNEFSCETCVLKDFSVSKLSRLEIGIFLPPKMYASANISTEDESSAIFSNSFVLCNWFRRESPNFVFIAFVVLSWRTMYNSQVTQALNSVFKAIVSLEKKVSKTSLWEFWHEWKATFHLVSLWPWIICITEGQWTASLIGLLLFHWDLCHLCVTEGLLLLLQVLRWG